MHVTWSLTHDESDSDKLAFTYMQANTVKPKPRPSVGSKTGIYKVDSIKVEKALDTVVHD